MDASLRVDAGGGSGPKVTRRSDAGLSSDASAPGSPVDVTPTMDATVSTDATSTTDASDAGDASSDDDAGNCPDGGCKPVICHGESECLKGAVFRCIRGGTALVLYLTCDAKVQVCVDSNGNASCAPACMPGAPICHGDVLTSCEDDGVTPAPGGTDCTLTGEVCDPTAAECMPKLCEPHNTYCEDGDVYQCASSGATESLFEKCEPEEFCAQYATSAYCEPDVCTPGQPLCEDTVATACKDDGSGGDIAAGTNCDSIPGRLCVAGACRPIICEPSAMFCSGQSIQWCDGTGTASQTLSTCAADSYCSAGKCIADVCPQGQAACTQNRLTTCNGDGSGFDEGGVDCAAMGELCETSVQCAVDAVDTIGSQTQVSYGWHGPGNVYEVRSDRHLTQIEMHFGIQGSSTITWFVYESVDAMTFTKTFELTAPMAGDGSVVLASSGLISVVLRAGEQYIIGVDSQANLTTDSQDYSSVHELTSFGVHLGVANLDDLPAMLTWFRTDGHFSQRLTTTL